MLAIAAAGAFVGLFALWVIVPRKLLKDRTPRQPRNSRFIDSQEQDPPDNSATSAPCGA